ncbi:MAG: cytochrome c [Rhodomicrobium sp.]|nr:cytochrome c [Rhodomicrobium sp.]
MAFARVLLLLCCLSGWAASPPAGAAQSRNVESGRYLFYASGCASCHAAPASAKCGDPDYKDPLTLTGGRCLKSAFGTFYVPNITPDKHSGIGGWSDGDFIRAMTEGVSPKGRHYYPAFPYTSYRHMTRDDLLDLKAFLDTLKPVPSDVPQHKVSFPYTIRWGLGLWNWLYLGGGAFAPDPSKSAEINRGAYLVEGPGHCGGCHTPRNWLGARVAAKKLAGAPGPDGKGFAPNLTPDATGLGSWSKKDIVYALETGFTPDGDAFGGPMAKVQENMAKLTAGDREAIAAYLKSIPPVRSLRPAKK